MIQVTTKITYFPLATYGPCVLFSLLVESRAPSKLRYERSAPPTHPPKTGDGYFVVPYIVSGSCTRMFRSRTLLLIAGGRVQPEVENDHSNIVDDARDSRTRSMGVLFRDNNLLLGGIP